MCRAKPEPSLRSRALRALARREYSRAELKPRLSDSPDAATEAEINALLDALERQGWLSDERAAQQLCRIRGGRYGSSRIVHEMRQKGLSEELIGAALPALREDEVQAARRVWQKKFGIPPSDMREKARQMRFLQSRGFPLQVIIALLKEVGADGEGLDSA